MSLDMVRTKLEGFSIQYDKLYVGCLNIIYAGRNHSARSLRNAGRDVSPRAGLNRCSTTEDNYSWFYRFGFPLLDADVVFLFPWCRDFYSDDSPMDRSINLYSNLSVPEEFLEGLVKKVEKAIKKFSVKK